MLRSKIKKGFGLENFQVRGANPTRLEALSDGVFALAIALLLISTSVPSNYPELVRFVYDFFAVGICILFLYWMWSEHCCFFFRYGLEDGFTIRMNFLLLFFVIFYAYPLKFLMSFLIKYFGHLLGALLIDRSIYIQGMYRHVGDTFPQGVHILEVMVIYGFGYCILSGIFYLLYRHAWKYREELRLNEVEGVETRYSMRQWQVNFGVGVLSVAIASLFLQTQLTFGAFFSGLVYNLIWVYQIFAVRARRKQLALLES